MGCCTYDIFETDAEPASCAAASAVPQFIDVMVPHVQKQIINGATIAAEERIFQRTAEHVLDVDVQVANSALPPAALELADGLSQPPVACDAGLLQPPAAYVQPPATGVQGPT